MARLTVVPANPLDQAVEQMSTSHLECRVWGHMWRPTSAEWRGEFAAYVQTLQCQGCGTERDTFIRRDGTLARGSRYRYDVGYLVKAPGLTSIAGRAALRRAAIA